MLEKFIFENHLGLRFEGLPNGVYLNYNDLRDYSWSYDTINSRISRFYRPITNRKLPLVVMCDSEEDAIDVKNKLMDISEVDIEAKKPGRIFIGDYYTTGYITASSKKNYLITKRLCNIDLTLTSDDPAWYREEHYPFSTDSGDSAIGGEADYPYDFPYDYAVQLGSRIINCKSVGSSAFKIKIYGAITDPVVTIGGHQYALTGTIEAGESVVIDSLNKTITLTKEDGKTENWFDKRSRDHYVFEPIPSGRNLVYWSGNFNFDLTVIEKRSEPRWT